MQITEARVDRGKLKQTFNSPHLIACSDDELYVVKPRREDRQFANELLAAVLGEAIGLPMPPAALVSVDELFRSSSAAIADKYIVGLHFGTKFLPKCWTFDNPAPALARSEIRNIDKLYGVVAFDEMVANTDRKTNPGNNMVVQVSTSSPRYDFVAIDHGHILTGHQWTVDSLRAYGLTPIVPVFKFVETCLTSLVELRAAATSLRDLRDRLAEIVESARSGLTQEEKGAVVEFLSMRAEQLPGRVEGSSYRQGLSALQP